MRDPQAPSRRALGPRGAALILIVVLAVHVVLVVGAVLARGNLWHDEAISILSATGHQDEWAAIEGEGAAPYGQWAPAGEYQDLLEVDRPFDLQGVSRSVGDYDHHPPLFYWLYHLVLVAGVPLLWAGPVLNLLVMATLLLLLVRFVDRVTGSGWIALLAAAAVAWSPAVVGATAEALPYPLLALMLLGLVMLCGRIAAVGGDFSRREIALLFTVLVAGFLTNHQFAAFSGIALVVAWWWGASRRLRVGARLGATWLAAAVVSFAVFPYFFDHLSGVAEAASFDPGLVVGRLSRWLTRAVDVIAIRPEGSDLARWGVRAVLLVGTVALAVRWRQTMGWMRSHRSAAVVVVTAVAVSALPPLLYALQRTPQHAYGSRYVAFLWPLLLIGFAVTGLRRRHLILGVLALASLGFSIQWVVDHQDGGDYTRGTLARVSSADAVLTDCAGRGYFPTVVWHLEADTPVLLATGADLAAAIAGGEQLPSGRVVLLSASCRDPGDVGGVLAARGIGLVPIGSLERYAVLELEPAGP